MFLFNQTHRREYGVLETKLLEKIRFSNADDSISKWYLEQQFSRKRRSNSLHTGFIYIAFEMGDKKAANIIKN